MLNQNISTTGITTWIDDMPVEGGKLYGTGWYSHTAGVFQATITRSMEFRCAAAYTDGKLWLQEWRN